MGKRQDLELEAIRLYADGVEIPAISAQLGVSENSLRKWKQRAGTEWQEARKASRQSQLVCMEDVGSRIRRSREITAQLLGDAKEQGSMGLLLNQGIQSILYDLMGQIQSMAIDSPENMAATIDQAKGLALTLARTEQAANLNLKREAEIRRAAQQEAVENVEKAADTMQLRPETLDYIKKVIYGLAS